MFLFSVLSLMGCGEKEVDSVDSVGDCEILEDRVCGQQALQSGEDTACPEGWACWGPSTFQCYQGEDCNLPVCLSADTLIATPDGPVLVSALQVGQPVWSLVDGVRVERAVVRVDSTEAPETHELVALRLQDGRTLQASPGHPTVDGRTLGELQVGDNLDASRVVALWRVPYGGERTWDLLPESYQANGIWLASTLDQDSLALLDSP